MSLWYSSFDGLQMAQQQTVATAKAAATVKVTLAAQAGAVTPSLHRTPWTS